MRSLDERWARVSGPDMGLVVRRYGSGVSSMAGAPARRGVSKVETSPAAWREAASATFATGRVCRGRPWIFRPSRLCQVPGPVQEAVAFDLARGRIVLEGVERLALIGPHLLAVVPDHDGHIGGRLGVVGGCERRPVLGAGAVAHRFAPGVLVESIKGH